MVTVSHETFMSALCGMIFFPHEIYILFPKVDSGVEITIEYISYNIIYHIYSIIYVFQTVYLTI